MKKIFLYTFFVILISIFFAVSLWYLFPRSRIVNSESVSPLPDFLTMSKNNQVRFLDIWFPALARGNSNASVAGLTAKSALIYDLTTDRVIFEKDANKRYPMASLTKIMTAIVTLENPKYDDRYVVSVEDLVGEDSMGIGTGEIFTQEELLYGLLLPSGNDTAETLANNFPTGRNGFIDAMNDKARSLGLTDTYFTNPSGLQGDGEQYTTAYNLLVITRYALENFPLFAKIVSTPQYIIPVTETHESYLLTNATNLLTTYAGVKGVKTGYTPEAGLCLVTYIDYGGHKMIGIILNSENRRDEMRALLDYALRSLNIEPPEYKG